MHLYNLLGQDCRQAALEAALGYFADGRQFIVAELISPVVGVALSVDGDRQTDVVDGAWRRCSDVTPVTVRNALRRDAGRERRQLVRRSGVPEPVLTLRVVHARRPEPYHAVVACSADIDTRKQFSRTHDWLSKV